MLVYEKLKDGARHLFGTWGNIPQDTDEQLMYTDSEGTEVHPTLSDIFTDDGNGGILFNGVEMPVYLEKKNIVPGTLPDLPTIPANQLWFTAEEAGSTIGLAQKHGDSTLKYSTDASTWTELNTTDTITLTNVGDKVYFRGTLNSQARYGQRTQFTMTGKIAASGSIMSILCDNPDSTELQYQYCCDSMFLDCTSLTTAPELPATTLTPDCYANMF